MMIFYKENKMRKLIKFYKKILLFILLSCLFFRNKLQYLITYLGRYPFPKLTILYNEDKLSAYVPQPYLRVGLL